MLRISATCAILALTGAPAFAQGPTPTAAAAPPGVLIAQVDDSDLADEANLEDLKREEYDKDSWSMGKAIGLSMVPGGGLGLVYAEKKAQATVPILLSIIGYGLGAAYMLGVFDEESKQVCLHGRDGSVGLDECEIGNRAGDNQAIDPRSSDGATPYFATKADYTKGISGEDFNGKDTGVLILGATYIGTTIIGAVWAGLTVAEHNERLRRDIDSTVKAAPPTRTRPIMAYDGRNGLMGLAVDF